MFQKSVPLILLLLFLAAHNSLFCTSRGFNFFKNYNPEKEYDIQPLNFSIVQDKQGIIHIGNTGGVVLFDGVSWRLIPVPNNTVPSLGIGKRGTVYIGGKDELGYLAADSSGMLRYVSLLDYLPGKQTNFGDVHRTYAADEGIYFMTRLFLFRWLPDRLRMDVLETNRDRPYHAFFYCRNQLYIQKLRIGLMKVSGSTMELIPGGEEFASTRIRVLVPFDNQKLLLGTRERGFFLYNGTRFKPFPTQMDKYLKSNRLHHGIRLSDGTGDLAIAAGRGGLVILDVHGGLVQIYNKTAGLMNDAVYYVYEDSQGNVWLAKDKGVTKIEYKSPLSVYDGRSGLPGLVLSVMNHRGRIYAGTTFGLFTKSHSGNFQPVPSITGFCRSLASQDNSLLAASTRGIFQVYETNIRQVTSGKSLTLAQSINNPQRIWAGTDAGLVALQHSQENGHWREERRFPGITEQIHSIIEDRTGDLWLGTLTRGVIRVRFSIAGPTELPATETFHTGHGLPAGEIHVFKISDQVIFASPVNGLFCFNEGNSDFLPYKGLGPDFAGSKQAAGVFRLVEDDGKNIWIHSRGRNIQAVPQPGNSYLLQKNPFLRIPPSQVNFIYPDPGGRYIWFAGNEGLFRFDRSIKMNYRPDYATLIREVLVNEKPVFNGTFRGSAATAAVVAQKDRNLRFRFAAPFFQSEEGTRYQFMLEGYDNTWSQWSRETQKEYTNLDSGNHTFRVRSMNTFQHISREAVFRFRVLPPWYKKWWAITLLGIAAALMIAGLVRWRSKRLVLEKQRLEQVVSDRTNEIEAQKRQLENQSQQLKELNVVKSRFFANISHEFRTPLTLITGPLEQLLSLPRPGDDRELSKKLKLMLRNSQRLLNLINQLLDLSRFESGKMRLQAVQKDIIPFVKGLCDTFEVAAEQMELDLQFHSPLHSMILYYDPEKLEKVLVNLLSNAVKFTPAGGRVTVSINRGPASGQKYPEGSLDIGVRDTGTGIPANQLPYIFDHFYQVDAARSHEHKHKGSGIGLALTKELVMLHHGHIDVRSSQEPQDGSGSEFILHLPLGRTHLDDDEIYTGRPDKLETTYPTNVLSPDIGPDEPPPEPSGAADPEKPIILVVEDSADVRSYIRGALDPMYSVVEASDGSQGMEKAAEIIPDLIISDIMMPKTDGYRLCRELKKDKRTSHIPIILLTARASQESLVKGLETGADDYVTKPFNTAVLLARIKNLIHLRRQLHLEVKRRMTLQPTELKVSNVDKQFLKELRDIIEENLSDPDFNVAELSKKLYMSRVSVYRKIMALCGEPPTEYIKSYRLERAAHLFRRDHGSVTEVAFEVGFASRTYFTKCFKERFNQLPSDFLTDSMNGSGQPL